jgi:phosphonate transport system substrate-binding protein
MNKHGFAKRITGLLAAALLMVSMAIPMASASSADKITIVWYPNESAADYQSARDVIGQLITDATGKEVEQKLTTDYSIAIESLASGQAQICFMGAQGYIQAKEKNANVNPLFVNSGASGTLDDAIYYSWLCVNQGQEEQYKDGDGFSIANIQGKKISFVSNSSTSGFKVPTNNIVTYFSKLDAWKNLTSDDLVEGGSDKFFSEVLFGGSHQGSAFNLLNGAADVAAFCDTELAPYADLTVGTEEKPGAVYTIKADATAPFDTVVGKSFVIIQSTPVLNGPFAYNADTLSAEDAQKIQTLFLSEAVTNNPDIFITAEGKEAGKVGMFKKSNNECFLLVDDAWYNPIRDMAQ